jgi:hypothetical protein
MKTSRNPHRQSCSLGRRIEALERVANLLSEALGLSRLSGKLRADILEFLQKDSGPLQKISTDARSLLGNLRIATFVEKLPTRPFEHKVRQISVTSRLSVG